MGDNCDRIVASIRQDLHALCPWEERALLQGIVSMGTKRDEGWCLLQGTLFWAGAQGLGGGKWDGLAALPVIEYPSA